MHMHQNTQSWSHPKERGQQFHYEPVAGFPPLAWLAVLEDWQGQAIVYHGTGVERRSGFFIEGVWNGPFSQGGFTETECVFGSGASVGPREITFVTSCATTDALYFRADEADRSLRVSNSLSLLLAFLGEALDPQYRDYHVICESIVEGLDAYEKTIPTVGGAVRQLYFHNLVVDATGPHERPKKRPPRFADFAAYREYLKSNLRQLVENARSKERTRPLKILSTQSRGFDTTCINALSEDLGIDRVYTCTTANVRGFFASNEDPNRQPNDDGTEICRHLGLRATAISRRAFERGIPNELLYYCAVPKTTDANLTELYEDVSDLSILLTGQFGELWRAADEPEAIGPDLMRWDSAGQSIGELRLNDGFVQVAVPFIGGQNRKDVARISNSEEMQAFRSGLADYDKPIPRRIGVEAGVPAPLFGQWKMASTVSVSFPTVPLHREIRDRYFEFLVSNKILNRLTLFLLPVIRKYNSLVLKITPKEHLITYCLERALVRFLRRGEVLGPIKVSLNSALFCFAVNERAEEYNRLLAECRSEPMPARPSPEVHDDIRAAS